jgi:hypothetical protein
MSNSPSEPISPSLQPPSGSSSSSPSEIPIFITESAISPSNSLMGERPTQYYQSKRYLVERTRALSSGQTASYWFLLSSNRRRISRPARSKDVMTANFLFHVVYSFWYKDGALAGVPLKFGNFFCVGVLKYQGDRPSPDSFFS